MGRLVLILVAVFILYAWWRPPTRRPLWGRGRLPLIGAGLFALAYLLSPIDAIPDVTPVGRLDDVIVIAATGWWIYTQWQRRPRLHPAEPAAGAPGWDPYAVLELRRGATRDEISRAYREQMKRYHPDRVSGLGDELQRLAHRKTLEIQRAYDELRGR